MTRTENCRRMRAIRDQMGRQPRPFRSVREGRLIRTLVWAWFCDPRNAPVRGRAAKGTERKTVRALARDLDISHKWIWVLRREFEANPERQLRFEQKYGPATLAELRAEQEKRRLDFVQYRLPRIKRPTRANPERDRLEQQLRAVLKRQKNWVKDYGRLPQGVDWLRGL